MQLLRLADVPAAPNERVFRYSRSRAVIGATILAALAAGSFLYGWRTGGWLACYLAAIVVICLLIFQKLIIARFQASNWLVRMADHGLLIKFRSYLNSHFSDQDITVVFVPYSAIRSAGFMTERQELPDRSGATGSATRTRRFIELELDGDLKPLAKALAGERERLFAKSVIGAGRISTRYRHLPVQLLPPAVLRIEWGVVPKAQMLLEALSRRTLVREPAAVAKDFVDIEQLSRVEQEARLLELAAAGDTLGAITMARRLYSYDLTEAKQFVEELMRRQTA